MFLRCSSNHGLSSLLRERIGADGFGSVMDSQEAVDEGGGAFRAGLAVTQASCGTMGVTSGDEVDEEASMDQAMALVQLAAVAVPVSTMARPVIALCSLHSRQALRTVEFENLRRLQLATGIFCSSRPPRAPIDFLFVPQPSITPPRTDRG
jgi:hypothetical protein